MTKAEKECREAWSKAPAATWAWCCHHAVRIERLTEPAENRIDYIIQYKRFFEQETRLNNFRPVLSVLPTLLTEAWKARDEAGKAYDEAENARDEAWKVYDEALRGFDEAWKTKELAVLHKIDVPHNTWNGTDIF